MYADGESPGTHPYSNLGHLVYEHIIQMTDKVG